MRKLPEQLLSGLATLTRRFHPPGTNRCLRWLHHPDRRQTSWLERVIPYDDQLRIRISTQDFLEWLVFFFGYHEVEVVREIKRRLRPGGVGVDIGANSGCHTLIMAAAVGAGGRVLAAEPNPAARWRLEENLELNRLANVTVLSAAFSDQCGSSILFIPQAGTANRGVASLYQNNVNYKSDRLEVEARRLDEEILAQDLDRLDLIKVDTEGNELKVLAGGRQSLLRWRPVVIFEYDRRAWGNSGIDYSQAESFFAELDYSISQLGPRGPHPLPTPLPLLANLIAIPRSR